MRLFKFGSLSVRLAACSLHRAQNAETDIVILLMRAEGAAPAHRANLVFRLSVASSAYHAVTSRIRSRAHRIGLRCSWIIVEPVPTPFPYIPAHVI
jgi:hypothetical protein